MKTNMSGLTDIFGHAFNSFNSWIRDGLPCMDRPGQGRAATFDTTEVHKWLVERAVNDAIERIERTAADSDIDELRKRKLAAEAELKELDLGLRKGDVIDADEFHAAVDGILQATRGHLCEVMPARAARRVLGETSETDLRETLREEARQACAEIWATDADVLLSGAVKAQRNKMEAWRNGQ